MDRRTFVSQVALGALGLPICGCLLGSVIAAADETGSTPHWGYAGADGPERWGTLTTSFAACSVGTQQSPIDLSDQGAIPATIGQIQAAYHPTPLRIINNGHTIQVNCGPGSRVTLRGHTYDLVQFHFHTPSEHTHNGSHYPMELHLVHLNAAQQIAVLGVFLAEGSANPALDQVWEHMPPAAGPERAIPGVMIDPSKLMPASDAYFAYNGSLTTPPCTEGVRWVVLRRPASVSSEQVARFRSVIAMNSRPVQNLGQRFLLEQL